MLLNVGVLSPQADASVLIIHFDTMIHEFARSEVFIFAYRGRLDEGGYMTMHLVIILSWVCSSDISYDGIDMPARAINKNCLDLTICSWRFVVAIVIVPGPGSRSYRVPTLPDPTGYYYCTLQLGCSIVVAIYSVHLEVN